MKSRFGFAIVILALVSASLPACKQQTPSPPPERTAKAVSAADCEARRAAFDAGGRIVGGEPAKPGSAPWQVEILSSPDYTAADRAFDATLKKGDACKIYLGERKDYELSHKCGGSYIGDGWVITAAHCVDNIPSFDGKPGNVLTDRRVRLGTQNLTVTDGIFAIDAVVIHKAYARATLTNDIALIRLKSDDRLAGLLADKRLAPVATMTTTDRAFDPDEPLRVTGWGYMGRRDEKDKVSRLDSNRQLQRNPAQLQQLTLNYLNDETCKADYGQSYGPGMLCAASLNDDGKIATDKDSCQGDSGGPLTRQEQGGRRLLVGLVSGGKGCAAGKPAVYTRVSAYTAWIAAAKEAAVSGKVERPGEPAK